VPTLDELAARPERVKGLPVSLLASLQLQLSAIQGAIAIEVMKADGARDQPGRVEPESERTAMPDAPGTEEWIKGKAVTARFGLPRGWLHRHRAELQRAGIVRQFGHRTIVYEARRLDRFLARTARSPVVR
jgi:hypothetical protein